MKVHLHRVGPAVLLVVVAPRAANGAEPARDPIRINLDRTRSIAAESAPIIVAARARADIAASNVAGASVLVPFNPQLTGGAGPRVRARDTLLDVDIALRQRFEIGGQRSVRIDRAEADTERSRAIANDELRRTLALASATFVAVLHAEAAFDVRTESASVARSLLASVRRRHDVGEIGGLDVNVATVSLARANAARERAAARRADALGRLRGLLGFDPSARLEVDGALNRLPDFSDVALEEHLEARPDFEAVRASARSAEAEVSLGRAEAWPDVGVFVRYGREENADIATGGLSVFVPIFDHGQGLRERGRARLSAAEAELDAKKRMTLAELAGKTEAYAHLRTAVRAYETEALPHLFENLERGRKAYQAGAIPIGEFLSIQREMVAARISYVDLLLEARLAAFEIESMAGLLPSRSHDPGEQP
ncbi:MAG: TolC family protein [Deltaproteobacteria bacterium]|jgi:cobalt-zinc-cadmium efflux system outer membrane protein